MSSGLGMGVLAHSKSVQTTAVRISRALHPSRDVVVVVVVVVVVGWGVRSTNQVSAREDHH
jgi:hypothetical protein